MVFLFWGCIYISKSLKSRWWWFIAYPDSLPSQWLDVIYSFGIPCIVSPLHDKDITEEGILKKAHYHIIVIFDNPTTFNHVNSTICKSLNATIPQVILNLTGSVDYLTHKGIATKAQYENSLIMYLNGADRYIQGSDYINDCYSAIETLILEHNIGSISSLLKYAKLYLTSDCVSLVRSKPYYWRCLMNE